MHLIYRRHIEMTDHDRRQPCRDILAKRTKVDTIQIRHASLNGRQHIMRVADGTSMPRKVLSDTHHSAIFETTRIRHCQVCHLLRVATERATADRACTTIAYHIEHRPEYDIDAQQSRLTSHLVAIFVHQLIVGSLSQSTIHRISRCIFETHTEPPLSIHSHKQRHLRNLAKRVGQDSLRQCVTLQEQHPTDIAVSHISHELTNGPIISRGVRCRHKQLSDHFLKRHSLHHRVCPLIGTLGPIADCSHLVRVTHLLLICSTTTDKNGR